MNSICFQSASRADLGEAAAQGGFLPGQLAHLFVEVSEEAVFACAATLRNLVLLARLHSVLGYKITICRVVRSLARLLTTHRKLRSKTTTHLLHRYLLKTSIKVPETLDGVYTSGFYA